MTDNELVANALRNALAALRTDPAIAPVMDAGRVKELEDGIRRLCEVYRTYNLSTSVYAPSRDDVNREIKRLGELIEFDFWAQEDE